MVAKNETSSIGIVGRTGWTTCPAEKRRSADVIVWMRSSIVNTDLTSASVNSRNMGFTVLKFYRNADAEDNRRARGRRAATADRRRVSLAARPDDARQARVGADARRSPAARADARAARARRHVRRDP